MKLDWLTTVIFSKFSEYGSCEDTNRRHSSGGDSARKKGPYLVPNTFLMRGDVSLYITNDSDPYIQLKEGMVVAIGQEALHIEEVSASDGLLTKWNGQSALDKSNGFFHLD